MNKECIFCKIASKEIPVQAVYEDEHVIAFPDINPVANTHVLIIPKQHFSNLLEIPAQSEVWQKLMSIIPLVAAKLNLDDKGFRVVINTKADGGQTIDHLHVHLLGGRSMTWPPG